MAVRFEPLGLGPSGGFWAAFSSRGLLHVPLPDDRALMISLRLTCA